MLVAFAENWSSVLRTACYSGSGDPLSSSGLCEHQHTWAHACRDKTESKKKEGRREREEAAGWEGVTVGTGDNCEAPTLASKVTENVCASRPQAVCPLGCLLTPLTPAVGTQSLAGPREGALLTLFFLSTLLGKGFSQANSS